MACKREPASDLDSSPEGTSSGKNSKQQKSNSDQSTEELAEQVAEEVAARSDSSSKSEPEEERVDKDGNELLPLGRNLFISVRESKKKVWVDIRQYYTTGKGTALNPGRKGIPLNVQQWENLKQDVDAVDRKLKDLV